MAGRPKGYPKTGGRKKGTPNKHQNLARQLDDLGIDIVRELFLKVMPELKPNEKAEVYIAAMKYVFPQVRQHEFKLTPEQLASEAESYLKSVEVKTIEPILLPAHNIKDNQQDVSVETEPLEDVLGLRRDT